MFLKRTVSVGKSSVLLRGLTILRNTPSSGVLQDGVSGVALDPLKRLGCGCLIILKNPEINIFFHIQI